MKLVGIKHRGRASLEIAHGGTFLGHDQCALELASISRVDPKIGRELHRAFHTLGNENKRAITKHGGIERREIIIITWHHRPQVFLHQLGMVLDRLAD